MFANLNLINFQTNKDTGFRLNFFKKYIMQ